MSLRNALPPVCIKFTPGGRVASTPFQKIVHMNFSLIQHEKSFRDV